MIRHFLFSTDDRWGSYFRFQWQLVINECDANVIDGFTSSGFSVIWCIKVFDVFQCFFILLPDSVCQCLLWILFVWLQNKFPFGDNLVEVENPDLLSLNVFIRGLLGLGRGKRSTECPYGSPTSNENEKHPLSQFLHNTKMFFLDFVPKSKEFFHDPYHILQYVLYFYVTLPVKPQFIRKVSDSGKPDPHKIINFN